MPLEKRHNTDVPKPRDSFQSVTATQEMIRATKPATQRPSLMLAFPRVSCATLSSLLKRSASLRPYVQPLKPAPIFIHLHNPPTPSPSPTPRSLEQGPEAPTNQVFPKLSLQQCAAGFQGPMGTQDIFSTAVFSMHIIMSGTKVG